MYQAGAEAEAEASSYVAEAEASFLVSRPRPVRGLNMPKSSQKCAKFTGLLTLTYSYSLLFRSQTANEPPSDPPYTASQHVLCLE